MSEPFALYQGGQIGTWQVPGLRPGHAAQLARIGQLERAEQEREQAERHERAEDRLTGWIMHRCQELAADGVPFDPSDMSTLVETREAFLQRMSVAMDVEDRRTERRALIESGQLHLLAPSFAERSSSPGSSRADVSRASAPATTTSPVMAHARHALHRITRGRDNCMCQSCVKVRVERRKADDGVEITRYTGSYR